MEKRPLVVLLGGSLLMDGVAVSLAAPQLWKVIRLDIDALDIGECIGECMESLDPDLIVFELDSPWSSSILSLIKDQPDVLLIGLDLSRSRAIVLDSHQHLTQTMSDLCQVVQSEANEKARSSKGGAITGRNGTMGVYGTQD
jgi:hypothetical protein